MSSIYIEYKGIEWECQLSHASDPCDSYILSAAAMPHKELRATDDLCNILQKEFEAEVREAWYEHQIDRADWAYEQYKDGTYE